MLNALSKLMGRKSVTIAVGQMCSGSDRAKNLATATKLAELAVERNAKMLFLPESTHFLGESSKQSLAIAEPLDGPALASYAKLAKDSGLWLSLGGFQERHETSPSTHLYNTHVIINNNGEIVQSYRKIHLFDYGSLREVRHHICTPPKHHIFEPFKAFLSPRTLISHSSFFTYVFSVSISQSSFTAPGTELAVCDSAAGRLGLSVCYDLRFPPLYSALRHAGAEVLLVPAAFTYRTGVAHWTSLLRARAIENQCYVIAAAQTGVHETGEPPELVVSEGNGGTDADSGSRGKKQRPPRESFGHACVIDPWGQVIAEVSQRNCGGIAIAELDWNFLEEVRRAMPVLEHEQPEAYKTVREALAEKPQ
jgi:predicted amidohydrolase